MLTACHKGRTYFPKDLEPQRIELVRFDNALLNVHEATIAQDIRVLYEEYPVFMPLWVEDILGIPSEDTLYLEQDTGNVSVRFGLSDPYLFRGRPHRCRWGYVPRQRL